MEFGFYQKAVARQWVTFSFAYVIVSFKLSFKLKLGLDLINMHY